MIQLGVNIDHVATLRQARGTRYPNPLQAALVSIESGADFITAHLREDRRHIQERDIELLNEALDTRLNLEMAMTNEMLYFAQRCKPTDVCLVPEKRQELTTEGGLDIVQSFAKVKRFVGAMGEVGIRVSLFIDPDNAQIDAAQAAGAMVVEFHTGKYAEALAPERQHAELTRLEAAVRYANQVGLRVHAGHGLNYHNVQRIAAIPGISELNIGHAIVCHALFVGLKEAVREMKHLIVASSRDN